MYSDELYRLHKRIDRDIHEEISNRSIACFTSATSYDDLIETLESCKKNSYDTFSLMIKNATSCRDEIIQNNLRSLVEENEKMNKLLEKMK